MIDFRDVKQWLIGQYEVVRAQLNGTTVWEKQDDYAEPFYFENPGNNSVTVYLDSQIPSHAPYINLFTSTDKVNWVNSYQQVTVPAGGKVYVRAYATYYTDSQELEAGNHFRTGGNRMNIGGNIMSLLYGDQFTGNERVFPDNSSYVFYRLFYNWSGDCDNLLLPATTLNPYCYADMFRVVQTDSTGSCGFKPPKVLPATTLAEGCYKNMFSGIIHDYDGTIIESQMEYTPELPATTLAVSCYESMFENCRIYDNTLLRPGNTPELPATILVASCYKNMFNGSIYVNEIKCNATDISATDCTLNWVNGVAQQGTFHKNASMTSWSTGTGGIPSGWTVQDIA